MTAPLPPAACRTCRHPLNVHDPGDGRDPFYFHGAGVGVGHDPDPYLLTAENADDCLSTCDLDGRPGALWTYPCDDFVASIMVNGDGSTLTQNSSGDWGACDLCRHDIEADDYPAIIDRFFETRPEPPGLREYVTQLHAAFREHRTGPGYFGPPMR